VGEPAAVALEGPPLRQRGYWGEAVHALLRDWTAMIGAAIVVVLLLLAAFASVVSGVDPAFQYPEGLTLQGEPLPPGDGGTLGTDPLGRDEWSRLLHEIGRAHV
jgi:ABC-type dipeptide/oligopeptide/nickel transport system permease subunit